MSNIDELTNPDKYCTGHVGDMTSELLKIYNNTLQPFDRIRNFDTTRSYSNNPSCVGFISPTDDLLTIFEKDKDLLQSKNITHDQIADKLQYIIEKYRQVSDLVRKDAGFKRQHDDKITSLDIDYNIMTKCGFPYGNCTNSRLQQVLKDIILIEHSGSQYLILNRSSWGYQCCPFRSPKDKEGVFFGRPATGGGDDYWIYDIINGKSLSFNDLHVHMIREHGFFQGSVPYRLEPEYVINFFNLCPDVDYHCKYRYVLGWKQEHISGNYHKVPSGTNNIFEIRHIKDFNDFNPPLLDRFISYPADIPSVAEVFLVVKERSLTEPINVVVHGIPLTHLCTESTHEDGFKYLLKYRRELV